MLATMMERPNVAPWFHVYRPMDLSATGEPLPVIVWANGGCFRSDFTWAPLFERWAAGGFVVLALTDGPDGPLAASSVEDHGALVDWALAEASKAGSPFADKLDTGRIVAAGNSCGGVTALGVAAKDERVAAVFVLSGSSALAATDTSVMSAIEAPVGYVVGNEDEDIASPNAFADYEAMADGVPAMIVSRASGDHITVSTDTAVLADVAEIALNWMDLALYGTHEAGDALTSPTVCASCDSGIWTLTSKHLETLRR
jgi:predicted dienelactone hydrolase